MDFTKAELEIINTVLRERLAQVEGEWLGGIPTRIRKPYGTSLTA